MSHPFSSRPFPTSFFQRPYHSGYDPWASARSARNATRALISLNLLVFGSYQYAAATHNQPLLQEWTRDFTLSAANISAGRYWTLLTSSFAHQDPLHLLFNMLSLGAFAGVVRYIPGVGGAHVLGAALTSGVAGSLAWLYHDRQPRRRQRITGGVLSRFGQHVVVETRALGASGAVMGMGALATCLAPMCPMRLMFIPIAIPLWVVTGAYAVLDTYYLDSGSRIGHAAHLGGFLGGAVYYLINLRNVGGIWMMMRRGLRR